MGLFRLALIGGAAYYAGKKMNEGNNGQGQGPQGGCPWRKRGQDPRQQHNQQYGPPQDQSMNRDMHHGGEYHDYPEKTPQHQQYYPGHSPGYAYAQPPQEFPRDLKVQPQTQQVSWYENAEKGTTPPAYGGYGQARPLSPHQRLYLQQEIRQPTPRVDSPKQQQQPQYQQMHFEAPKQRSSLEKLMWKE